MQNPDSLVSKSKALPNNYKLEYIDSLRGIAILAVILIHTEFLVSAGGQFFPAALSAFIAAGGLGVQLFFVASAFTMFYSLSHRRDGEKNPTLNFFIRRYFRIAPCYYFAILGYMTWYYYVEHRTFTLANILAEFTFIHGISPYWINTLQPGGWSITVEMTFYSLVPFLFKKVCTFKKSIDFLLATICINMFIQFAFYIHPLIDISTNDGWFLWTTYCYAFLPAQLPIFALGFLFYFLTQPGNKSVEPWQLIAGFLLLMTRIALDTYPTLNTDAYYLGRRLIGQPILAGVCFVLLALALQRKPYTLFVNPVTRYIGTLSFSLYLCHFLTIFILNHYGWANVLPVISARNSIINFTVRFLFVCAGSIPLAYLLNKFVESPGQRLGKKVIHYLESR